MTDGLPRRETGEPTLSVVIPTYEEADRIEACLDAVFESCRGTVSFEVIVVDSNSSDGTVAIAREYPITLLCIPDDELTTPAAGRYVGTKASRGDVVMFVDGDIVLEPGFLEPALEALGQPGVAGVEGTLDGPPVDPQAAGDQQATTVESLSGVALYEREPLEAVGGFDPFLRSLEDIHLGFSLRAAGYRLLRIPVQAATHPDPTPLVEPIRRWRAGYALGVGQTIRTSLSEPAVLRNHLVRLRHRLLFLAWFCVGLLTLALWPLPVVWAGLSAVGATVVIGKLGLAEGVTFLFAQPFGIAGLLGGLFVGPKPREAFPLERVETIRLGPIHTARSRPPRQKP